MINMLEAVYSQYTSQDDAATLRGLVSRFHFGQADASKGLPIVVYNIIAATTDYAINNDAEIDTYTLQFSIFAKSYIATMSIYDAINTAYQNKSLTYSTGAQLVCRRETMVGPIQLEDAYQITTDYLVMYHLP